jgi:hypothetical protein
MGAFSPFIGRVSMQRIWANEPGAGAATLVLVLATWLGTTQAADALSPLDPLTTQQSDALAQQSNALPDEATAYADPTGRASRHRRLWRHVRHHRRHTHPEMEASAPPVTPTEEPTTPKEPAPLAIPPQSVSASPSTLQLVLTAEDGGDPFEQLMTAYYWSRLNHAMPTDQIFEPAQKEQTAQTAQTVIVPHH